MPNPKGAGELLHVPCAEDIFDQAIVLPQKDLTTISGGYPSSVLTSVL
tara:strand:- start:327 stop:470 length:144 start_codon:yes stop_codon:yes gene_type:complete